MLLTMAKVNSKIGNRFKSVIRCAWTDGRYDHYGLNEWANELQQIRNAFGPSWLSKVTAVSLDGVAPPQEVAQAFHDVTSAREDRQRTVNEAEGYQRRVIPQARGEAKRITIDAEAYHDEVITMARGDARRFEEMAAELSENRALTTKRLILETLEEVLPRLDKVILDSGAGDAIDLGLFEERE